MDYLPFNSIAGDRVYKAEDWAWYFGMFISNGVFANPTNSLQIFAYDGMDVIAKPGAGFVNGYGFRNRADYVLHIDNADGTYNRIDRVVLRWDLTNRQMLLAVLKGTVAAAPVAPALTRTDTVYELALADIEVPRGAVTISQSNITDQRGNTALCNFCVGLVDQIDWSTLTAQLTAFMEETEADLEAYMVEIHDILDSETASHLLNLINGLQANKVAKAGDTMTGNLAIGERDSTSSGNTNLSAGTGLKTGADNQIVGGAYNEGKSTSLLELGNGTSSTRQNAFEVTGSGDVVAAGDIEDGDGNILSHILDNSVLYTSQTRTNTEKVTARHNIDAGDTKITSIAPNMVRYERTYYPGDVFSYEHVLYRTHTTFTPQVETDITQYADVICIMDELDRKNNLFVATCSTAAATQIKEITLDDNTYTPVAGDLFVITMTNDNTANIPQLKVNSTSARWYMNGSESGSYLVRYDGTYFRTVACPTPALASSATKATYDNYGNTIHAQKKKRLTVPSTGWSASTDSNGYYTATVTISSTVLYFLLDDNYPPNIYLTGSDNTTAPTTAQKTAYGLVEKVSIDNYNASSVTRSQKVTLYATTKPTETFYIFVEGWALQ